MKINVGKPSRTYHANKQLLCGSSDYFRAASGPRWIEGKTGVVDLPDDDASAFQVYLTWIHKGILSVDIDEDNAKEAQGTWRLVIMAYALGDKLLDVEFKDAITDAIARLTNITRHNGLTSMPGVTLVKLAYKISAHDSKLNLLIAHRFARLKNVGDLLHATWPVEFLFRVSRELVRVAKEPAETTVAVATQCVFHEHAPGSENCYRGKRGS